VVKSESNIKGKSIIKGEAEKKAKRSQSIIFDAPPILKRPGTGLYATRSRGIDEDDDDHELSTNVFDPIAGEEIEEIDEIEKINAVE
jgi:hypothetical protein